MSGLTRYVLRQLAVGMVFVSAALACILWLTQSLRFIDMIVNKGLSVLTFLKLTMMLMPGFLVVIIPVSLFAVILFTYNRLVADRELVVMRAIGLSHFALARPALILGGVLSLAGFGLTCWLIPLTVRDFHEMQWTIRNDIGSVLLQEGSFNKFGDGLTIYVRSRTPDGELSGILVHDQRRPDHPVTLMAERGALVMIETGPRVLMINGNRQEVRPQTGQMSLLYFDSYVIDLATAGGSKEERTRDARERGMAELLSIDPATVSATDYRRMRVELHGRLTSPLHALGLALLGAGILLTSGFDRRGQTWPLILAIGTMVFFEAIVLGSSNLASGNLAFIPLIYAVTGLPIALGLWLLLRPVGLARRRPPSRALHSG